MKKSQARSSRERRRRGSATGGKVTKSQRACPGDTLDRVPTQRRAQPRTYSHTTDNFEVPVSLQRMPLGWGRKPEYSEETPEARGEHANSTHTGRRRESNPQPQSCRADAGSAEPFSPMSLASATQNDKKHSDYQISAIQSPTSTRQHQQETAGRREDASCEWKAWNKQSDK